MLDMSRSPLFGGIWFDFKQYQFPVGVWHSPQATNAIGRTGTRVRLEQLHEVLVYLYAVAVDEVSV